MKNRSSDGQPGHGLPPPPAPTSRGANPWSISPGAGGPQHEARHPRASGWPRKPGSPKPGLAGRKRRTPWMPLLVLFAILGTGVQMAIRALVEGDVETAIGALVIFAVVAVVAVRRILERKSR